MAVISTFFCLLLLISFVPSLVTQDTVFDVELVHRDSPQIATGLGLSNDDGDYFMGFKIGTPNSQSLLAIVDSGGGLTWVNNVSCKCFKKKTTIQFNPNASLSYKKLSCLSDECKSFRLAHCNFNQLCQYHATFGDGSNVDRILSSKTFSFTSIGTNQNTIIPNKVCSCNFRSLNTRIDDPDSFIGGAKRRPFLGCGKQMITRKMTVTPLMTQDYFYAMQLHTISIPGEFDILLTRFKLGAGNIIFDIGTVLTMLDTQVVNQLVRELMNYVSLPIVKTGDYKLCFNVSSTEQEEQLPGLLFSFDGTLGNFKEDILVGHYLDNMELTIKEKNCT
ncbi:aspartic proteinase nepenthesin-1-like [Zingiber officinale]|uniref:aspartic proteinase nepenthesin-1-like n=1 Tax=Zingiber officinale TaxID=94328 RepID=UPI001C4CE164|nr:aspartic proteinase nepenthesin-1-like [Zingiber officinale]